MDNDESVLIDFSDTPVNLPRSSFKNNFSQTGGHGGFSYPVDAYFLDGRFINSYSSIAEAILETGVSKKYIERNLYSDENIGDIVFTYKGESFEEKMKILKKAFRIIEYNIRGDALRSWRSPSEAAKAYNVKSNDILRCVKGIRLTVGGKIFLPPTISIRARLFRINYKKKNERQCSSIDTIPAKGGSLEPGGQ